MKIALIFVAIVALVIGWEAFADTNSKTIIEWNFNSPSAISQWKPNSQIEGLEIRNGCLVGLTEGADPILTGPFFECPTSPFQFVEIRAKTNIDGRGELFWTNTTEEPFGGFRQEKADPISFKKGDFHVYRIFPFWQKEGKIIRLRLDPPSDCEFAIDYIRIMELPRLETRESFFDFRTKSSHWLPTSGEQVSYSSAGMKLTIADKVFLVSPALELNGDENMWLAFKIRFKGNAYAIAKWVTDALPGVQSATFRLNGDGNWHIYNIRCGDFAEWQGKITLLGLELCPESETTFDIAFAGASKTRLGPAELLVTRLGFTKPINRAGTASTIRAEITNVGGKPTSDLQVSLTLGHGVSLVGGVPNAHITSLEPGSTAVCEWSVYSASPGISKIKVAAKESSGVIAVKQCNLRWDPPVQLSKASYVPEPKPVKGDIEVGMYYYPGWWDYHRWAVLDEYPERRPVLGYYREGEPEVADWHIKWMVEHGVSFIVYDWYWCAGGRSHEHALHNGYLKSKYRDKIKFCLLWANHNPPKTSSAEDMANVTNYWLDNYFSMPEYFKIDGKPVVIIFSPNRLTEDMGSNGVREALEKSREMAKSRGLPGIYFVGCVSPNKHQIETLENEGYDALSGYNYPSAGDKGRLIAPYDDMVVGYQNIWNTIAAFSKIPYIPVTEPGWDSRPWHGINARVRTGKTPEKFAKMLQNAKEFLNNHKTSPRIVLVEAWNEFGEGDYTEPHLEWGFGYLDAIRRVFTTAPDDHIDVVPQDVGLGPYEFVKPKPVTSWMFDGMEESSWSASQGLSDVGVENGCLVARSVGSDPAFYGPTVDIDASKYKTFEIRMKVDKGKQAQVFWAGRLSSFNEKMSVRFDIIPDGKFHLYKIDLGAVPTWRGKITSLRFDPTDTGGARIEIDHIRFLH
ncbi:MAG: glycoside hydrolase family 99-like domain-containing protein [Armatimonadota bacterium]|nr:glycoside hydrolase family 99-like domain-containing protein [Armatimonadota bacterium]